MNGNQSEIYYCLDVPKHNTCFRNSTPNEYSTLFDMSILVSVCDSFPNQQVFSLSYTDPNVPEYTFITSINCVVNSEYPLPNGHNFHYYIANDLTVTTISNFLREQTSDIQGSTGFIVETKTGFLIACK